MKRDEQVSAIAERLLELGAAGGAERLRDSLLRWIEDPLRPRTAAGRLRINPTVLLLALLPVMAAGTFLFFCLGAP